MPKVRFCDCHKKGNLLQERGAKLGSTTRFSCLLLLMLTAAHDTEKVAKLGPGHAGCFYYKEVGSAGKIISIGAAC